MEVTYDSGGGLDWREIQDDAERSAKGMQRLDGRVRLTPLNATDLRLVDPRDGSQITLTHAGSKPTVEQPGSDREAAPTLVQHAALIRCGGALDLLDVFFEAGAHG
jgi:hypothetical protein